MAQSFTCPSCGAPLNYKGDGSSTISCPYCYTSVIVPQELRTQQSQPVAPDVSMSLAGQAHKLRELSNLIRAKQGDQAIALYQQVYGVDSGEAQRLVEQLLSGGSMVITSNMGGMFRSININTASGNDKFDRSTGLPNNPPSSIPTSPSNYSINPAPVVYTTNARTGTGTGRIGWLVGCVVVFGVVIALISVAAPLLIGGLALLPSSVSVSTTVPIKLPNINATTTAAFALATQAQVSLATEVAKPSATASSTPAPTDDVEGTATAAALASADADLVSTQSQLPILFSDTFETKRSNWEIGPDNNDYFNGTRAIANGNYIWTFNAKRDVASFVYPKNVKATGDFYASVDIKIVGSGDSDAGLVFRHKADDAGWYYFALGGDGQYSLSYYGDAGWETLIALTSDSAVKTGDANKLAVAAQDAHYVLLINDTAVASVDDDRIASGDVGLAAELANPGDSGVFSFDNFEVRTAK
jgi:hypothetical protein